MEVVTDSTKVAGLKVTTTQATSSSAQGREISDHTNNQSSTTKIPAFVEEFLVCDQEGDTTGMQVEEMEIPELTPVQMQDLYDYLTITTAAGKIR